MLHKHRLGSQLVLGWLCRAYAVALLSWPVFIHLFRKSSSIFMVFIKGAKDNS